MQGASIIHTCTFAPALMSQNLTFSKKTLFFVDVVKNAARRGAFWRHPAVRGLLTLLALALGGLLGRMQLQGELAPFAELLHWGQWLHVGKNTSFGLGGYRLATPPHADETQ